MTNEEAWKIIMLALAGCRVSMKEVREAIKIFDNIYGNKK